MPCFCGRGTIWNVLRCALHIISGIIILNFAFVALCGALQTHFHEMGRKDKRQLFTVLSLPVKKGFRKVRRLS